MVHFLRTGYYIQCEVNNVGIVGPNMLRTHFHKRLTESTDCYG
jgi:hypothetical protein